MKNIVKFSYLALVSLFMVALNACTDDYEYTAANAPGNEVYFSNTLASTIEIDKEAGSFDVALCRIDDKNELTVPLTFEAGEGNIFTVPSSVSFAAGEKTTNIHITYNPDDVQYGTYTGGTIKIGSSDFDTTYGIGSYTFSAGKSEWVKMKDKAWFREGMVSALYGTDPIVYQVDIEESVVVPGMYRLVNPYGPGTDFYKKYVESKDFGYEDGHNTYIVIDATDPDYVYIPEAFYTGTMTSSEGLFFAFSYVQYYLVNNNPLDVIKRARPQYFGKLVDGVITFPSQSLLVNFNGELTPQYYGNGNGLLAVALPGHVISDYSISATYIGRFTDPEDNDFAQMALTFGDDVASVKYALVPQSADVDATVQGIIDGSVKSEEATSEGTVQVAYDATGKYNFVMVVYNAAGEAVGSDALEVKLQSSKDAAEQFTDIAAGTFTIGAKDQSAAIANDGNPWGLLFEEAFKQEAILSQSQSNPARFKLTPYLDEEGNYPLYFTMAEDGTLVVEEVETGVPTQKGMLMATDIVTFFGADSKNGAALAQGGYGSTYDKAASTFNFNIIYTDPEGGAYGFELETFEVTKWADAAAMKQAMRKAMKAYVGKSKKQVKGTKHLVCRLNKHAQRFQ